MSEPLRVENMSKSDAIMPPLKPWSLEVRFAHAVLLFFRGGFWTHEDHLEWQTLTGTRLCTTRNLGDMARQILAQEEKTDATGP